MERKHAERLHERFPAEITGKTVITLDIPDDFAFMDQELVALLQTELAAYLVV